jgi:HD-GYP domain-containing protein (c-di-GMP phosphodiesterase class II)
MQCQDDKLQKILNLGLEISQIKDIDLLLEKILVEARTFTNCDAGSIYVKEGDTLRFSHTQNDTLQKRLPPGKKLPYYTFNVPINNESIAGYVATNGVILNIADVYELDSSYPFSFNRSYDAITGYRTSSMLTIPLKKLRGDIIGVLQLINATNSTGATIPFAPDEENIIIYFSNTAANAVERAKMTREIILRMNKMAELRDPKETGPHVNRVGAYATEIYQKWALTHNIDKTQIKKTKDVLRLAAMMHDVGKVAISDLILKKPGKLTDEERAAMKYHTIYGGQLFRDATSDLDLISAEIALNHHEYWDGRGYPGKIADINVADVQMGEGKKADEAPLFGRIVALADVYDALSCKRVYKDAWSQDQVLEEIKKQSGQQFDPSVVEAFLSIYDVMEAIMKKYSET